MYHSQLITSPNENTKKRNYKINRILSSHFAIKPNRKVGTFLLKEAFLLRKPYVRYLSTLENHIPKASYWGGRAKPLTSYLLVFPLMITITNILLIILIFPTGALHLINQYRTTTSISTFANCIKYLTSHCYPCS